MAKSKPMPPPSAVLKNERWEIYAQARSRGRSQADAWSETFPNGASIPDNASLRVGGHRCENRKSVALRIKNLTQKRREAEYRDAAETPEVFDHATIVALSLEISETLENAMEAAEQSSLSSLRLSQLKSVLSGHLGRQGKLAEQSNTPLATDTAPGAGTWQNVYAVEVCQCSKTTH